MKTMIMKTAIFFCYLAALVLVWSASETFGWLLAFTAKIVLGYCGIIVAAQLVAQLAGFRHRVLIKKLMDNQKMDVPSGAALETEGA